eukprot:3655744-Lingulodinium_polyedra.AAC.1
MPERGSREAETFWHGGCQHFHAFVALPSAQRPMMMPWARCLQWPVAVWPPRYSRCWASQMRHR